MPRRPFSSSLILNQGSRGLVPTEFMRSCNARRGKVVSSYYLPGGSERRSVLFTSRLCCDRLGIFFSQARVQIPVIVHVLLVAAVLDVEVVDVVGRSINGVEAFAWFPTL